MTRSDEGRVRDILRSTARLLEIRDLGRASFDRDWVTRSAACYELAIVGEALNALTDDFLEGNPGLPVREAKDLRNLLVHQYYLIDDDILWDTICTDIPRLARFGD